MKYALTMMLATACAPVTDGGLPFGADTSHLTSAERAVFWHAAEALNAKAGMAVFAPEAVAAVTVLSGDRECELGDVTGWYSAEASQLCINFEWILGGGAWAADQLIGHELLHVVGLGHSEDPESIMFPNITVKSTKMPEELADLLQSMR